MRYLTTGESVSVEESKRQYGVQTSSYSLASKFNHQCLSSLEEERRVWKTKGRFVVN